MMKSRLFAFLAILILVAGLVPAVSAQEATPDPSALNCLNLSEADCAIVKGAGDDTQKVTSFAPSFSFDYSTVGASAAMGGMMQDSALSAKGTGAVVIDHAAMTKDAPYNGISASFDVDVTDSKGSKTVSFVLAGGALYWKDNATGEWQGAQIGDLLEAVKSGKMPNVGISMDSFGPMGGMMNGMGGMMGDLPDMSSGSPQVMGMDMSSLFQIPGFLKQEREADTEQDGQTMQVFTYTADIGVFLSSEPFQKMLNAVMTKASSGAQNNPMASQMMAYLPIMLESTTGTATLTRWIGADDHFTHHIALEVNAAMDLFGGTSSTKVTPIPPIEFNVSFALDLTGINTTTAPTAPAGATMLTAEQLMASPEATPESTPAQ